jgi:Nucleotidyl transferase AbiEii toxin, Type IV TA system
LTRPGPKKNLAASVRERLMQLARARNEDFNFVLTRYGMERILYRLSKSQHEPTFVLKGALLFTAWSGHPHRATKDIDLLGTGTPDLERLRQIFRDICAVPVEEDGVLFDADSVVSSRIKGGSKLRRHSRSPSRKTWLRRARPADRRWLRRRDYARSYRHGVPSAPDRSGPTRLRMYPRETVVAEKFEAMLQLGIANSRMKNFFDILFLARSFEFDGATLLDAISTTLTRRGTPVPAIAPVAFTAKFRGRPPETSAMVRIPQSFQGSRSEPHVARRCR